MLAHGITYRIADVKRMVDEVIFKYIYPFLHRFEIRTSSRYVKLILECSPIWLILGQIGYWDDIR